MRLIWRSALHTRRSTTTPVLLSLHNHTLRHSSSNGTPKQSSPQQQQDQHEHHDPHDLPLTPPTTPLTRIQPYMDSVLTRLTTASQLVNSYTGTDFTPISTLRAAIATQESLVESLHAAVRTATTTQEHAVAARASGQREVVQLLERKHSWAPPDLERYMALIRSEHEIELAVQSGKEGVRAAERDLEAARQRLERLERRLYHEEQLWSDTIRRNSTWVTFGLMGVNVVLLFVGLVVVEPWRRRRLVKELQESLGGGKAGVVVDDVPRAAATVTEDDATTVATDVVVDTWSVLKEEGSMPAEASMEIQQRDINYFVAKWNAMFESTSPLVNVTQRDVTVTALEGAAVGAAAVGILLAVLRARG